MSIEPMLTAEEQMSDVTDNPSISEVSFTPVPPRNTLLGFGSIVFHGVKLSDLALHVARDGGGYSIAYPRKRLFNGAEINIIHPTSKQVAEVIRDAIVTKYLDMTKHE